MDGARLALPADDVYASLAAGRIVATESARYLDRGNASRLIGRVLIQGGGVSVGHSCMRSLAMPWCDGLLRRPQDGRRPAR